MEKAKALKSQITDVASLIVVEEQRLHVGGRIVGVEAIGEPTKDSNANRDFQV